MSQNKTWRRSVFLSVAMAPVLAFGLLLWLVPQAEAVDLVVTATSVVVVTGDPQIGTAGVTVTAGQTLYKDPADSNKLKLADCNAAGPELADCVGIALNNASTGQPVNFLAAGDINPGAALVVGTTYILSATPGGIAPIADHASTWRLTYLGYATTTSNLRLMLKSTQITKP